MIRNKSDSMQFKRPCLRKYYKKLMKKFSQFRLNAENFPKQKALGPLPKKVKKIPGYFTGQAKQIISNVKLLTFFYQSFLTFVFGAQNNHMFWLRNKKNFNYMHTYLYGRKFKISKILNFGNSKF